MAWQFPLHSGKAFGWPGRIAIFMTGIATCMFIVTGLMMWARKRAGRRKKRPHAALIAATGADVLDIDTLAGGLLAMVEANDAARKESWRKRGQAFFQRRTRSDASSAPGGDAGAPAGDGGAAAL